MGMLTFSATEQNGINGRVVRKGFPGLRPIYESNSVARLRILPKNCKSTGFWAPSWCFHEVVVGPID
jgi:hypothetical protein